jgi:BatD DUF11 like domain
VKRLVSAFVLLLLSRPLAAADDTRVRAEVDASRIGLEDQLELHVVVEGPADVVETPMPSALKNLRLAGGPSVSQQFSFVNGATSQSRTFTYVLQPQAVGPAEVGALHVKLSSGEKLTQTIAVEVVAGSAKPRARNRRSDPFGDEDPFASLFGRERRAATPPKLMVEAVPSRTRLHVGEPLLLVSYVYTQVSISDLQFKDPPQYPGFWSEDVELPKGPPRGETVTVAGETFQRFPIGQKLLFPTKAGTLTIPPALLRLGVSRQSFFDPGGGVVERATKPVTIVADPVPTEPGFGGAVGRFHVRATLDKSALAFGEAATLRFEVEGTGNLKWIDQGPELRVTGAKVFPPQVKSNLKASTTGLTGTKTWEYVVVPETAGTVEVPALTFEYFDPEARQLVRVESAPLALRVEVGGSTPLGSLASGGVPAATRATSSAGLALRSDLDAHTTRTPFLGRTALLAGVGAMLVAHVALWGAGRLRERGQDGTRRGGARSARAALAQVQRATRGGQSKEAATALIEQALHDVFGPVEDDAGPPADERERAAREVLDELRFIRYAPQLGDYSEKIKEVAARATSVLRRWA